MPRSRRSRQFKPFTSADFFSSLPEDELTSHESALRLALIDFAESLPGPFPLTEWIEQRVGGELGLTKNDNDGFDIHLVNRRVTRPGDWECPNCGMNVFAKKDKCFKCGTMKPMLPEPETAATVKNPADWMCPACGAHCFASKDRCFKCGEPKERPRSPSPEPDRATGRPGDWTCPACGANVFASKDKCFKCKEPKPRPRSPSPEPPKASGRPGDWTCPACGANVFASKDKCFKCKEPKPDQRPGTFKPKERPRSPSPEPPSAAGRPGDWTCPACGAHVFGSKDKCFKCKEPRPRSPPPNPIRARPGDEIRPGDWQCPTCDNHCFAFREECSKCGTPKPNSSSRSKLSHSEEYPQDEGDVTSRVCTMFQSLGTCKFGNDCKFSHDQDALLKAEETYREFFDSLPQDALTDEEEDVREALLDAIEAMVESVPTMKELLNKPAIKRAWKAFHPKHFVLPLSEWVEARIGQELHVHREDSGRAYIGLPGRLASGLQKRKAKEESDAAPAPKSRRTS